MQNTIGLKYENLRIATLNSLVFYLMSTVFERHVVLNFISTVGIYTFLAIGMLYICLKRGIVGLGNSQVTVRLLLFIIAFISLIRVPETAYSKAIMYGWRFFTSIIIAFITGNIIYTEKDVKKIMVGFCAAGAFLSLNFYITYGSEILTLAQKVEAAERLGRDYGNVNEVAQRCMFSFIICTYYLFFDKNFSKKWKFLALIDIVLCFSVVMFTGSRRALLVIAVAIVVMFLINVFQSNLKEAFITILKGCAFVFVMVFLLVNVPMFSNVKDRIISLFQLLGGDASQGSTGDLNRLMFIREGIKFFNDNILFGGGMSYSYHMFQAYAHNNYIEMLINFGLVGFAIYYYGYVSNLVKIFKLKVKNISTKNLFLVLMISIMFVDIGVVSYYERYICIILSLISAYFTNKAYLNNEDTELILNEHIN